MEIFFEILQAASLAVCLGLAWFILSRSPRALVNIGFALGLAAVAMVVAGNALVLMSARGLGTLGAGAFIIVAGKAMLPPFWLVFTMSFARGGDARELKKTFNRNRPLLLAMSLLSLFFIFWEASYGLLAASPLMENGLAEGLPRLAVTPIGRYFYIYLILGMVLNMVNLETILRSSSGAQRWRIKYIVFGVGALLAYFIYLSAQAIVLSSLSFETIPLTSAVVTISTAMMGFFIVRHRLMDTNVFVSRYVVYNSVTILVVGLYLLAVGLVTHGIRYFGLSFNYFFTALFIFTAMLALMVALFTEKLKRRVRQFINRNFFRHKYEFRDKWMETIEKVSSRTSVEDIMATLKDMVGNDMGAKPLLIWLYDQRSGFFATDDPVETGLKRVQEAHPFAGLLRRRRAPFMLATEPGALAEDGARDFTAGLLRAGCVVCSPLMASSEAIGFIAQGPDFSGEPYGTDDFEFLQAVTTQAAVQIKNIRLASDLLASKEAEAFSRMSSFIMHDLKNLTNSLSLVSQNARDNMDDPEFRKEALKTIEATVLRMKSVIEKLSSMPREVELRRTETDIAEVVRRAIRNAAPPAGKNITLSYEPVHGLHPIFIDQEAVEMVIQNLITNALDAISGNGSVRVTSAPNGRYWNIAVADNGVGMTDEFLKKKLFRPFSSTKSKGFGVGLYQCKTIVDAHGGEIHVESEPGKGSTFIVRLPLKLDEQGPGDKGD